MKPATEYPFHITVSPLDYVPPRNYVRILFPLPLKNKVDPRVVFEDLHEALHKTFVQEPWVAGKVFRQSLNTPGWRPGQMELRYAPYIYDQPRPHNLTYQQLEADLTYEDFKAAGFPSGIFDEDSLLRAPRLSDVDVEGADIFLAQANFLPGGLLLGMTTSHAAIDASGMLNIQRMWAENFRELHERDAGGKVAPSLFKPIDSDRTIAERIWLRDSGSRSLSKPADPWLRGLVCLDSDYPGEDVTGEAQRLVYAAAQDEMNGVKSLAHQNPYGHPTPPRYPAVMLNRIYFLSATDLAALQKLCQADQPDGAAPISQSDAIMALFWRGVMRARYACAKSRGITLDEISVFECPVDVRDGFGADFPPNYLGNCFFLNNARMPLAELIAPATSLGKVTQAIRAGAAALDTSTIQDAYGLMRSAPDFSKAQGRFVERPESADCLLSNIIFFPMDSINFGERYFEDNGSPSTLRVLHGSYAPYVRLGHVLPKYASHGGCELSLNLFDDEMVFLDDDEEFARYFVPIDPPDES